MVKPMKDPVSSLMSRPVVVARPDDTIAAAVDTMSGRGISCLVVTGPDSRLLGIVTKTDLLKPLARIAVERPFVKLEISVKDRNGLDELDRERLASMLEAFARKHEKVLKDSVVSLYVKSQWGPEERVEVGSLQDYGFGSVRAVLRGWRRMGDEPRHQRVARQPGETNHQDEGDGELRQVLRATAK